MTFHDHKKFEIFDPNYQLSTRYLFIRFLCRLCLYDEKKSEVLPKSSSILKYHQKKWLNIVGKCRERKIKQKVWKFPMRQLPFLRLHVILLHKMCTDINVVLSALHRWSLVSIRISDAYSFLFTQWSHTFNQRMQNWSKDNWCHIVGDDDIRKLHIACVKRQQQWQVSST